MAICYFRDRKLDIEVFFVGRELDIKYWIMDNGLCGLQAEASSIPYQASFQ